MSDLQQETLVEQATFGAGCFWGAEASFRTLPGVLDTRVGFARSAKGKSEVIEVVQVDFGEIRREHRRPDIRPPKWVGR